MTGRALKTSETGSHVDLKIKLRPKCFIEGRAPIKRKAPILNNNVNKANAKKRRDQTKIRSLRRMSYFFLLIEPVSNSLVAIAKLCQLSPRLFSKVQKEGGRIHISLYIAVPDERTNLKT